MKQFIFIVGSPRSGTSITGKILETHPKIGHWYDPYFVWERYFGNRPNDELMVSDATDRVIFHIRDSFQYFQEKTVSAVGKELGKGVSLL